MKNYVKEKAETKLANYKLELQDGESIQYSSNIKDTDKVFSSVFNTFKY